MWIHLAEKNNMMISTFSYLPFTPYSFCKFIEIYTELHPTRFFQSSDLLGEKQVLLHDVATPYVEPMLAAVLRQAEAEFDVEASQRERWLGCKRGTLPETNIAHENWWLGAFGLRPSFRGELLVLGRVFRDPYNYFPPWSLTACPWKVTKTQ